MPIVCHCHSVNDQFAKSRKTMFLFEKSQENRDLNFITAKFIDITSLINYLVLNEVRFNFNSIYCFVGKTSC